MSVNENVYRCPYIYSWVVFWKAFSFHSHSFLECLKAFNVSLASCTFSVSKPAEGDFSLLVSCQNTEANFTSCGKRDNWQPGLHVMLVILCIEINRKMNEITIMITRNCRSGYTQILQQIIFYCETFNHCWKLHDWLNQPVLSLLSHRHGAHSWGSCSLLSEHSSQFIKHSVASDIKKMVKPSFSY